MKFSIIVPVYNEKETIRKILKRVRDINLEKEIIVVDDGSTDGTKRLLKNLSLKGFKIIYHPENRGKGAAIRTGLKHITGDVVIIQDADLEYDPKNYYRLIEPIVTGRSDVVYGSRILGRNKKASFIYYLGNKILTSLTNLLYHTKITDLYTGHKAFRSKILKNIDLKCKGFEFCSEVTAKISKQKYRIYEVPISYQPRSWKEGKKISWRDGLVGLWILVRYRFINY